MMKYLGFYFHFKYFIHFKILKEEQIHCIKFIK